MEDNPQMDEHRNNVGGGAQVTHSPKQTPWTPGPWLTQWEHDGDESIWSRDGGMHLIATCHAEDDDRAIPVKANAHLIAAAPDHHEVAEELHRLGLVIESAVRNADPKFTADVHALLAANRAALSKARPSNRGEA